MNPTLIKIAQFLARRPQDRTIQLIHILTGLCVAGLLWWAEDRSVIDVPFIGIQSPAREKNIEHGLLLIALFPLLRGILPWCLIKHSTLRILQGLFGFLLIMIGGPIMDPLIQTVTPAQPTNGFQIQTDTLTTSPWHPGIILILMGILWIGIGLTGKGTTEKCLRYGEVVKKIRV